MELFIVILIGLVVAVAIVLHLTARKKKGKSLGNVIKKEPDLPYKNWLTTMRTVFAGGTKDVQDKFLETEKNQIKKWSFYPDFVKKFESVIKQFGK